MTVSRRKLLQVLPLAAVNASAQTPAAATSADAELDGARRYQQAIVQTVRQVALPASTEPASRFVPRS